MNEQELILTSVLQCRRVDLYTGTVEVTADQKQQLDDICSRRSSREPAQYILRTCEFMGLDLYVDQRVLIPRPETELLVEAAATFLQKAGKPLSVLDIGTGSGNIIVSLAKNFSQHHFLALDISKEALEVASQNARTHDVLSRITFLEDDIFSDTCIRKIPPCDIIISNPPYIPSGDIADLQPEVLQEPHGALDGGEDGLRFYRRIAQFTKHALSRNGFLFLEVGQGQAKDIQDILEQTGHLVVQGCLNDYSHIERVVIAQRI